MSSPTKMLLVLLWKDYFTLPNVNILFEQDYAERMQMTCFDNSYKNFIGELSDTAIDPLGDKNARQWFYQTCTQFGYCKLKGFHRSITVCRFWINNKQ